MPKGKGGGGFGGNKGANRDGSLGGQSRSGSFGNGGVAESKAGNRDQKKEEPKPATSAAPPAQQTPAVVAPPPVIPRAPDIPATQAPVTSANPNLPADKVQADRGQRREFSLIDAIQQSGASRSAQKYKGSVLSAVYKLPTNPARAAETLQQFNGPRGQRMTLGA